MTMLIALVFALQDENVREARRPGSYEKILTPGQIDAWTLDGAPSETILAHVRSSEFDPVLELVGPDGRELRRVDDPGSESRYACELPVRGTYKVRVRGFQDKGGGRYVLSIERFVAAAVEVDRPAVGVIGKEGLGHHRVEARKGAFLVATLSSAAQLAWVREPNGKPAGAGRYAEAKADGPHYFAVRGAPNARYTFTVRAAQVAELKAEAKGTLRAGDMHVYVFEGDAGQFRAIEAAASASLEMQFLHVPEEAEEQRGLVAASEEEPVTHFQVAEKGGVHRAAALLGRKGKYHVRLLPAGGAVEYALSMRDPTIAIAAGEEKAGDLPIGGAAFFTFETKAPRLLRIDFASDRFDPLLRLYDAKGRLVEANDDGGGGLAGRITLMARVEGTYRLQASSVGDGGGGAFRLRVQEKTIQALKVGDRGEGQLTPGTSEFWTIEGRKDQIVILSARSASYDVAVRVFDRDGVELASNNGGGLDGGTLLALRFPQDGPYTVQVASSHGTGAYALRVIDDTR